MASNSRQIQQFIHQQTHLLRTSLNAFDIALRFRIERGAEFFCQHLGKAADVPQGCPQVVGHRVTESFQLFVGGFQLGCPLRDPVFEFVVELLNLELVRLPLRDVAESYDSPVHRAVLGSQRTTAGLDPDTLRDLWTAQKHLGRARLSVNRAYQGELLRGKERDSVDRKSTRLNSSHANISYAVFCLKK